MRRNFNFQLANFAASPFDRHRIIASHHRIACSKTNRPTGQRGKRSTLNIKEDTSTAQITSTKTSY